MLRVWEVEPESDSKSAVTKAYSKIVPEHLAIQMQELVELDKWYTQELEHFQNHPDRKRYRATISRLVDRMPDVYTFLKGNIMLMHESFDGVELEAMSIKNLPTAAALGWS